MHCQSSKAVIPPYSPNLCGNNLHLRTWRYIFRREAKKADKKSCRCHGHVIVYPREKPCKSWKQTPAYEPTPEETPETTP